MNLSFPEGFKVYVCRSCTKPCYFMSDAQDVPRPHRCPYSDDATNISALWVLIHP